MAQRSIDGATGPAPQIATRLSLFYAASFLVTGVQLPFWPVWLTGRGLDAHDIALLFAAAIWVKVVATPALGALADRLGRRRAVMIALAAAAALAYAALSRVAGFWPLLGLSIAATAAQSALMPLGDSITLAAVRRDRLDYGRIRAWGSVTFIAAAAASGATLSRADAAGPSDLVLFLVLGASLLLLAACVAVPAPPAESAGRSRRAAFAALAADRRFWGFVAATAAIQASHQVYYGFGSLYWRSLGFPDAVIGILWAEGVVAEIVLFWLGGRLLARLGPLGLMALGGVGGIVRWTLAGLLPDLGAAVVLQLLHALTFGATHLGAMNYLARIAPPGAAASAQSLYSAASAGLGSGLVMLGAGALYAAYGGRAYLFMALLSAAGLAGVMRLRTSREA